MAHHDSPATATQQPVHPTLVVLSSLALPGVAWWALPARTRSTGEAARKPWRGRLRRPTRVAVLEIGIPLTAESCAGPWASR